MGAEEEGTDLEGFKHHSTIADVMQRRMEFPIFKYQFSMKEEIFCTGM